MRFSSINVSPSATHMEVVPLPLELSGGVHLVGHDTGNGLVEKFNLKDNLPTGALAKNKNIFNLCSWSKN